MPDQSSASELICFNGIDGDSGGYEIPPLTGETLSALITKQDPPENLSELRHKFASKTETQFGVAEGIDANNLAETGWGIIFAHDIHPQIIEALKPLLDLRRAQAGERFFYQFSGSDGYQPNMTKTKFLEKRGVGPGPADPKKMPYYLLLVGNPEQIPYQFQTQLDVQYSVGRIHFDTAQEYANYAASVVAAETGKVKLKRQAAFFGAHNRDDGATALSRAELVEPLAKQLAEGLPQWNFASYLEENATRSQLDALLGGDPSLTPALLFSASHGMGFPMGSKRQLPHQGALLCQDWPGPKQWQEAIPEEFYYAADHLPSERNLSGMIAFLFACYGGGTPQMDQFSKQFFKERTAIAPRPFLASLPVRMLGLPNGGALAVIAHIERAWGYSFKWTRQGQQAEAFESALKAMLSGYRIGCAVEYFNERYAELSTVLSDQLEEIEAKVPYDPYDLAKLWTANNDARGYAIIGDPAVRLPVVDPVEEQPRREVIALEIKGAQPAPATLTGRQVSATTATAPAAKTSVTQTESERGNKKMEDAPNFAPPPAEPANLAPGLKRDLDQAYVKHVKDGYENTDSVFKRIMRAFLISHYSTVIMYWLLFAVGVALVVIGFLSQNIWATLVAGFGVAGFVAYFITRSIISVETNLIYITWLGVIYNTYWVHQQWSRDPEKAQLELDKASQDAIDQIKEMLDRYDLTVKGRPKLPVKPPAQPSTTVTTPPA